MKLSIAAVLALGPAATAAASMATVVKPMFFSEIVSKSELIFVGTVSASESRHEEGKKTIRTYVTLTDLAVQKGVPGGPTVTLRFEGGAVGDDRLLISDMPRLSVGGRYLLYVSGNGVHLSPVTGFNQGAFQVVVEHGREVLRALNGMDLVGVQDDRFVLAARPQPARQLDGPQIGAGDFRVKPAAATPDLEAFEAELVRRQQARAAGSLPPLEVFPPAGAGGNAQGALPPAHGREGRATPVAEATPIVVPARDDTGARMSLASILNQSARVR